MNLTQLLDEAPVRADLRAAAEDLVAAKAVTCELGRGLVPAPVREFVIREFTAADVPPTTDPARLAAARRDARTIPQPDALIPAAGRENSPGT